MKPLTFIGQTLLVTGASGFIGSELCRRLSEFDVEIHAVSRIKRTNSKKITWWKGDIADRKTVAAILKATKPAYIFNLAGCVQGSRDISMVMPTFQSNLMGQVYLLMEASKIGCKRFMSTGSMDEPNMRDVLTVTKSPYAVAKWAGGIYGEMFHALYGFPYVHLRVFMVYGPGQEDVRKLIPYSILSMLQDKPPRLSSGKRQIDWIYVEDVVDGILAAASTPHTEGTNIDIGSGGSVPIATIEDKLMELIHPKFAPDYGALQDRPFEQEPIANLSDTYARIRWAPKTSLDDGLKKTVRWYCENLQRFSSATLH